MRDTPNAKDGEGYKVIGDHLKVRIEAVREGSFMKFSPEHVHIELNGQPLTTCQELVIQFKRNNVPTATLTLDLESIDIDADTMTALKAILNAREGELPE